MTSGSPAAGTGSPAPGGRSAPARAGLSVHQELHVHHQGEHPRPGTGHAAVLDLDDGPELATVPHRLEIVLGPPSAARSDVEARKAALRRSIRARRRSRDAVEADAVDRDLGRSLTTCPLLRAVRTVACYTSLPGEPGTRSALDALQRDGVEVILPVLLPDADLDWTMRSDPAPRTVGEPPQLLGPGAVAEVDLLIVPALAVDTDGHRLGQGGGSYDRALRRVPPRVPVVALVHDDELLDAAVSAVPTLPHDRRVDAVVTPTRWLWLRS
ncbi:5-formyltetrahydrofolate cyclo-ligase [Kineococcus xinjiangensis]|uniref:5-formyltetrahydrofolate cyclo-ligase n=1 Tax=Kineococcus xinjiangensis TaxID=512762 RepID=A0A2S6ISR5_9ACTN|nr:5-formyltetrahydrofolate cyclo-ligase [Kineococcus xinjiangensis]PPK97289.1 5-formyltetrahydrofolate cyclo-ligase [Kineococcus xinjiangensis]